MVEPCREKDGRLVVIRVLTSKIRIKGETKFNISGNRSRGFRNKDEVIGIH